MIVDVEAVEAANDRLVIRSGDILTPLARDRAKELGLVVEVQGGRSEGIEEAPSPSVAVRRERSVPVAPLAAPWKNPAIHESSPQPPPEPAMKITEVESFVLRVGVPRLAADSVNAVTQVGIPGVMIHTSEGIVGTGFSMTLGSGDTSIKEVIDRYYVPELIGEDPIRHQHIWGKLYWSDVHWVGRTGITQMAIAAVDVALWDIKAKTAGLPLWRLIGGDKNGKVHSYNTDGGWLNLSVDELVGDMRRHLEEGYAGVKMKIGLPDPREDVRRVAAVREALGDEVSLAVDVNQSWDTATAVTWAPRFEEFELAWIEEPLAPDDVEAHARLAQATRIPIALGEHLYTRLAFRDYLRHGLVSIVQPDVTRLGVTDWLAVADMAQAYGIPAIPHAGDLMRVHQHLGVGHPASPMIECIPWIQEIWEEPADIRDGWFHLTETPGASTTFDARAMERFRVH